MVGCVRSCGELKITYLWPKFTGMAMISGASKNSFSSSSSLMSPLPEQHRSGRGKALLTYLGYIYQNPARQARLNLTTNTATNGRKQWKSQKKEAAPIIAFHMSPAAGELGVHRPVSYLYWNLHCQECSPAAPWLLGRPSPGDYAALPAAPRSPPVGYAGLFHTVVTSAIFYCGSGLT